MGIISLCTECKISASYNDLLKVYNILQSMFLKACYCVVDNITPAENIAYMLYHMLCVLYHIPYGIHF